MSLLAKLGILVVKTIAKPVAKSIKDQAAQHPKFRSFCINAGRAVNSFTWRVNILLSGHNPKEIKDISESRAVNLGAEILGEGIVMSVAAVAVFGEYRSRKYKEAQVAAEKDARRKERLQKMDERFAMLEHRMDLLEEHVEKALGPLARPSVVHGPQAIEAGKPAEGFLSSWLPARWRPARVEEPPTAA